MDAQNALTNGVLERCSSRDKFAALMRRLYDYPKYGTPSRHGDRYTYSYNTGLQVQCARWYWVAHGVSMHAAAQLRTYVRDTLKPLPDLLCHGHCCRHKAWCTHSARLTARQSCSSTLTSCRMMAQ